MATGYTKAFMPLTKVKEKEFMSRPMGCKGVGFSYVRIKPGQGAAYIHRHRVQEEVFIALDRLCENLVYVFRKAQDERITI